MTNTDTGNNPEVVENTDNNPPVIAKHFALQNGRRKANRNMFYVLSWILVPLVGSLGLYVLTHIISKGATFSVFGGIFGLGAGLWLRSSMEPQFRVNNPTTGIFMTLDPLKALFGREDVITKYPPGPSYCYPWEQRYAENNISLEEATNNFNFEVLCTDGFIYGFGSYRIRADKDQPVTFQAGVASVADDLRDLVIKIAVQHLAGKKVTSAVKQLEKLNEELAKYFANGQGVTSFESRHGVTVGDVTVSQLKPAPEVQKTISGLVEADAIDKGTAKLLGYTNMKQVREAVKAKELSQADVKDARDRFLAISGNLEGMDIKRQEIAISGIDSEAIVALANLAANAGKTAQQIGGAISQTRGSKNRGNKRNRQRNRNRGNKRNRQQGGSNNE